MSVRFSDLGHGWGATTKATVRDLWSKTDEGSFTGEYPSKGHGGVAIMPHATKLIRLTKAKA